MQCVSYTDVEIIFIYFMPRQPSAKIKTIYMIDLRCDYKKNIAIPRLKCTNAYRSNEHVLLIHKLPEEIKTCSWNKCTAHSV